MMKKAMTFLSPFILAAGLVAQGPPPGIRAHERFGPAIGSGFGIMAAGPASRTPVAGAPYSAVQTTQFQQTLSGGNQISRQEQAKVYRDKDGRVRTEHTYTRAGSTTPQTRITIFDPVGGFLYVLNPSRLTATKSPLPAANSSISPRGRRGPRLANGTAQVQKEDLGPQNVNGVTATATRTTETIAAGAIGNSQPIQIVREVWVSTDLKVPVMIKSTDPRFGNTVMNLTNIVQSEPDGSLFVVPSNYTVTERSAGPFGRGFGRAGGARTRRPPQE